MDTPSDPLSPALESVLTRYGHMVRSVGRRHGLADGDVDEVFQEVRIRLWKALGSGERIEAVQTSYVYRAATSAALDLIRRRRTKREEALDPQIEPVRARERPPDVEAEDAELADQVATAVDRLIDSRRPVVRMYLAGYRLEEIATLIGWSSAKTRNLLYRGLADLRERLTAMGIGPEVLE